ncbi:type II secretion system F family protein [Methanofollis aquaemaris]|uniref:Type II secretion system F family protein n=1 Tax=Methanofollis aquaemaris TaxID=126734 RepID=A0A8A3S4U8_9EURY|nr:type II secretion system F family protein [Methanofollis aquaemaris]QSZ66761.1 type II secretion system F family protein [Methanofollis aquaemaris]
MGFKTLFDDFLNRDEARTVQVDAGELDQYERQDHEIVNKIEHQRKMQVGVGRFLKHPIEVLTETPTNSLIATVPFSFLFFIVGISLIVVNYGWQAVMNSTLVDDVIVFSVLIPVVPLALLDFKEGRREKNLEAALPNFFRDVAGMNDSGMTLPSAIHIVSEGEYGMLTPYIRKLDIDMSWNVPFVEAITTFGKRIGTPLAERSVDLIAKASTAGGDVSEVLRAAARDSYEFINLKTERASNMLIYEVIIVAAFFVFLFVIAILESTFLTTMADAGAQAAASGAGSQFIGNVDMDLYKRIFSHSAMIMGFFSGLVAGQMGEGRAAAGLKFSALMLLIAWLLFRFAI